MNHSLTKPFSSSTVSDPNHPASRMRCATCLSQFPSRTKQVQSLLVQLCFLKKFFHSLAKDLKQFAEFPTQMLRACLELTEYYKEVMQKRQEKWAQQLHLQKEECDRLKQLLTPLLRPEATQEHRQEKEEKMGRSPLLMEQSKLAHIQEVFTQADEPCSVELSAAQAKPQNCKNSLDVFSVFQAKTEIVKRNRIKRGSCSKQSQVTSKNKPKPGEHSMDSFWYGLEHQITAAQEREQLKGLTAQIRARDIENSYDRQTRVHFLYSEGAVRAWQFQS